MFFDDFIDKLIALPKAIANKLKPSSDINARVERYSDLEGVTTKGLNIGLWYVKHTKDLFLILVWFLSISAAVLWSFSLYYLGNYLFFGMKQDRESLSQLSQSVDVVRYNYDVNLEILDAQALVTKENTYDLIGFLSNKNNNTWGAFNYYFLVDGKHLGDGVGFILPNETKPLISLNQTIDYTPSKTVLVLDFFGWRRLNAHDVPNWEDYKANHLDFVVRDKVFFPGNESGLSENVDINQLSFNVTNQTSFNFKQAPFIITLYNGQNIVAVNRYIFYNFKSRQKEQVNLTIIGKLPNITDISVSPDINVMDNEVYGPID